MENFWIPAGIIGAALIVAAAVLRGTSRYERSLADYRKYLRSEEERQGRESSLLDRQEQMLARIETLVAKLEQRS